MSRNCPECGVLHDTVLEETASGKILESFEKCKGCLLGFGPKAIPRPKITEQITLNE